MTNPYETGAANDPVLQAESDSAEADIQARIGRAKHEALSVIDPVLTSIERIETTIGVPLIGNKEVRSEGDLPPGVVLASSATPEEIRGAERVITDKEAERLYADMERHGVGRESDVTLAEAGLSADTLTSVEGGILTTKLLALKEMVLERIPASHTEEADDVDLSKATGDIIQLASPYRKLSEDRGEPETAARLVRENPEAVARNAELFRFLDVDPADPQNEWGAAAVLWLTDPEFVPADNPRVVGVVDVTGTPNGEGVSGELVEIGAIRGRKVYAQKVPRTLEVDPESGAPVVNPVSGKQRYIQPNSSQLAAAHAELLGVESAAVATSATYLPETIAEITETTYDRVLSGRVSVHVMPIAYGTARLAAVQGNATPERPSLAHALGGTHKAARVYRRVYTKIAG